MEFDASGNVYVNDGDNYVIRRVTPAGVVTTIAGQRQSSGAVDGAGTNASLSVIYDMKYDSTSGVIYFTDVYSNRIRALYPNITVGTIGRIDDGVRSIALDVGQRIINVGTPTSIYKMKYDGSAAWRFSGSGLSGFADGPATAARYQDVLAAERDAADNLYVADSYNCKLRKVSPAGDVVTIVGSSQGSVDGYGTNALTGYSMGLRLDPTGNTMYLMNDSYGALRRVGMTYQYVVPNAPVAIDVVPLPLSPLGSSDQLTAWRVLAPGAVVDARGLTIAATLNAANTAGMNPTIRTLLLGDVELSAQSGAGPADSHTFSTSARRALHNLALATSALPPYALVLPALQTLTINSVGGMLTITAGSFAGLDAVTCINCGAAPGLANLSGLGVGSSVEYAGNLSQLSASGLFAIPGITTLDLTANNLTAIQQHDFDGAAYLTALYIGGNPDLTFIHCAAFTPAQQPLLAHNNIDETGNPPSNWRAGCPSATPTVTVTPSETPTQSSTASHSPSPTGTATSTVSPTGSGTSTYSPTGSGTSSFSPTATYTPTGSGTPTYTPTGSHTHSPTGSGTPTHSPTASGTPTYTPSSPKTATPTGSHSPTASGTPSHTPTGSVTASATPSAAIAAAAASSSSYTPDMFAAALALGLLSVAFIIVIFCLCRRRRRGTKSADCCACGAGCAARQQRTPDDPPPAADASADSGTSRRIVIVLAGEEDSAAVRAARTAIAGARPGALYGGNSRGVVV